MKKIAKLIKLKDYKIIKNKKGNIIKFLNKKNKLFQGFGEIYFSELKSKQTKGWNYHKKNTCTIIVPIGEVYFQIFNPRTKKLLKISIGKKNNKIIQIPPGYWFSFKSKTKNSLVANLMNKIHSKSETDKKSIINGIRIK